MIASIDVRAAALLCLFAGGCASGPEAPAPVTSATLVIANVSVVDVERGTLVPDQSVVIQGDRIMAVGNADDVAVPRGARVVDASGKFLMPGLWDMHVHAGLAGEAVLPVFLANGITGVRDMGADSLEPIKRWRARIDAGDLIGPRIVAAGPMLDNAPSDWPLRKKVADAAQARHAVDSLVALGADFIKVHRNLPRDAYFAIASAASVHDKAFAGHLPASVSLDDASRAGQRSVEHAMEFTLPDDSAAARLYVRLRANPTWITPTLIAAERVGRVRDEGFRSDARMRHVTPPLAAFWQGQLAAWPDNLDAAFSTQLYNASVQRTATLHSAGVALLAGSDLGFIHVFPGSGLHEELELLVGAGLTPLDALRAATLEPARYLDMTDLLGTVQPGKFADLVLLDANPLSEIRNTRSIRAVIAAGRLRDRAELDRLLASNVGRIDSMSLPRQSRTAFMEKP